MKLYMAIFWQNKLFIKKENISFFMLLASSSLKFNDWEKVSSDLNM